MTSRYTMQIVDKQTGDVVEFEPGLRAEFDFVESCVERITGLGVGLGKSAAHVERDIRTGIGLAILDLKTRVRADGA